MLRNIALALFLAVLALSAAAQTETAPRYILSSGVSFDAIERQSSSVSTLAVQIAAPGGLPLYQATTIETGLMTTPGVTNTATVRVGLCQTAYRAGSVSLGGCTDIGATKAGDQATLGTMSGNGFLAWDVGAKVTKGKYHVFLIPTVRIIALSGVQVKPSYALRIGTGF